MVEQQLYEHLRDNVPSVESRVYADVFEQDTPKPALVYLVATERISCDGLDSASCDDRDQIIEWEIDVYAPTYLQAKQIKNEVVSAIFTFPSAMRGEGVEIVDAFDDSTNEQIFVQIIKFKTRS